MSRQKRQMIVMIVLLAVLAGAYFGVRQYRKVLANKPAEDTSVTVLSASAEDLVSFSYILDGEEYAFEKNDDVWYATDDPDRTLIQYKVKAMANALTPLAATQAIEQVTDPEQYGLIEPSLVITANTSEGSFTFYVGDQNDLTGEYYLRADAQDIVYTVASSKVSSFCYTMDELTETEEEASTEASESEEASAGQEASTEASESEEAPAGQEE